MRLKKRHLRNRNKRGFIELVSTTFLLAIVLPLVAIAIFWLTFLNSQSGLEAAAKEAAEITGDPNVEAKNSPGEFPESYLRQFQAQDGKDSYILQTKPSTLCNEYKRVYTDDELKSSNDAAVLSCVTDFYTRRETLARPGFSASIGDPIFSNDTFIKNFPFKFVDRDTTYPAYDKTQRYPFVNIRRGCAESFNETDAVIGSSCSLEKPQTLIAPGMADFDNDFKEDPVMFQPVGTVDPTNAKASFSAPMSEYDIVAYLSAGGYSPNGGIELFNLSRAPTGVEPADQFITLDVDKDGQTDPAVFSPATGQYRFINSMASRQQVHVGTVGVSDPTGVKGLVAFGGHFFGQHSADLVVVQTAGAAADRFKLYVVQGIDTGLQYNSGFWDFTPPSATVLSSENVRPVRGAAAYPAFADINGDGIIEGGYLSVYTGMPVKHVAGAVGDDAGATGKIPARLESTAARSAALNPKDIAFNSSGEMFILDPVSGSIHKSDEPVGADGEIGNLSTVTAGLDNNTDPSSEADYWPAQNVVNIPSHSCEDAPKAGGELGNAYLCSPRSIAVANCESCGDDLIIADTGHNALYVAVSDGGHISKSSTTYKLIDDDIWQNTFRIRTTFFPLAVLAVPNPTERGAYDILVANDYSLYLLRKDGSVEGNGPRPDGFTVTRIAGSGYSPWSGNSPTYESSSYLIAANGLGTTPDIRLLNDSTTEICPIVSLARSSDSTAVYAGLSCGTKISATDTDWQTGGVSRNVGGIIKIYSEFEDLANSPRGRIVLGSFRARPCSEALGATQQCGKPASSGGGPFDSTYGLFKRKINLSETDPRKIAAMNIVGLSVGSKGEVYFVDQWNEDFSTTTTTTYYGAGTGGFSRPDRLHAQGVYRLYEATTSKVHLEAISNPSFYGDNSIPVEHRKWFSPYDANNTVTNYIEPFEAPASQVPFPAGAGIAISPGNEYLFASTMWLINPEASTDPYYVERENVGFIFGAKLDTDGDGVLDSDDSDVDGDGVADTSETNDRNPFCPEIWGASSTKGCRWTEAARVPRQYYFNLDNGAAIDMPADIDGESALSNAATVEYLFFNSVSAFDSTKASRPEPWALLFANGHHCAGANVTDDTSPYYNCEVSRNGPIPSAVPLHSFVGTPDTSFGGGAERSTPALSPAEAQDLFNINNGAPGQMDRGNVAFPVVFDGAEPWNRGIKPTRRPMAASGQKDSTREIQSSGVLCFDGKRVSYGVARSNGPNAAFTLNTSLSDSRAYLNSYLYSGVTSDEDGRLENDNDNLNYLVDCSTSSGILDYRYGDTTTNKIYSEGVVLQLDHDYTNKKRTPTWIYDDLPGHWMPQYLSGHSELATPENARSFTLLDFDGNGARDYGVYATDVPYEDGWATADRSFTLTVAGLKDNTFKSVDEIRFPLSMNAYAFDQYPGAWFETYSTPWFRFKNKGWDLWMFDKSRAINGNGYGESFAISLDNQPYITRGVEFRGYTKGVPNNYANYIRSNRFIVARDGTEPPGIVAAKRYLKRFYNFKDQDFVTSLDDDVFTNGKVFVGFKKGDEICPVWQRSLAGDYSTIGYCDKVYIAYKKSGDGNYVVDATGYIPNVQAIKERCDPLSSGGSAFPCVDEDA